MKDADINAFINIADVMAELDTSNGYVQFMRIVSKRNESEELLYSLYEKAIREIYDIINLHHIFWAIAAQRKINIGQMIAKKPMDRWIATVDDWAKALLEEEKVALVPGTGFGAPNNVRLSYATSLEQVEKALERIHTFMKSKVQA